MSEDKKRVQYATSIDRDLKDKLQKLSEQTRIPQSKLIDEAIGDLLEKHGYNHNFHQNNNFNNKKENT